jgi:quercetin dioxygenase-like cupin family protein
MVEKAYPFRLGEEKVIERILDEKAIGINHMILPPGDRLPEHYSNAPVYMVVARGQITLQLNEQDKHSYEAGNIITIPHNTKMNVINESDLVTELFVLKAPGPTSFT